MTHKVPWGSVSWLAFGPDGRIYSRNMVSEDWQPTDNYSNYPRTFGGTNG